MAGMQTAAADVAQELKNRGYETVPPPNELLKVSTLPFDTLNDRDFDRDVEFRLNQLWARAEPPKRVFGD